MMGSWIWIGWHLKMVQSQRQSSMLGDRSGPVCPKWRSHSRKIHLSHRSLLLRYLLFWWSSRWWRSAHSAPESKEWRWSPGPRHRRYLLGRSRTGYLILSRCSSVLRGPAGCRPDQYRTIQIIDWQRTHYLLFASRGWESRGECSCYWRHPEVSMSTDRTVRWGL